MLAPYGRDEKPSRTSSDRSHAASVQDAIGGADVVVFAVWLVTIKDPIAKHARLLENKVVVVETLSLFREGGSWVLGALTVIPAPQDTPPDACS